MDKFKSNDLKPNQVSSSVAGDGASGRGVGEDAPKYRSMMVAAAHSNLAGTALPPLKSFASLKPPSKASRGDSSGTTRSIGSFSSSVSGASTLDDIDAPPRWLIREALNEVPLGYAFVSTNVRIKYRDPQEVANKICRKLQSLSLMIVNDDDIETDQPLFEGEKQVLLAESQYGMKLAVRMFQIYDKENNRAIVVEVKRASGCTMEFRENAGSILRSVKRSTTAGAGATPGGPSSSWPPKPFSVPSFLPKRSMEDRMKCVEDDVQRCCRNLLSSDTKLDSKILSLECMERMTTASEEEQSSNDDIVSATRNVAARSVLCHRDCLCHLILSDVDENYGDNLDTDQPRKQSDHHQSFSSIVDENSSSARRWSFSRTNHHANILRRKVLTVLSNSFDAFMTSISKGSSSDLEIVFFEKGTSELIQSRGFVSLLLSVIKDASSNPHDAYQAARCLRYLVTISATKEAVSKILLKKMKAEDFIGDNGEFFAKCHHDGLFLESKRLIEELNKNISSETNKNLAC